MMKLSVALSILIALSCRISAQEDAPLATRAQTAIADTFAAMSASLMKALAEGGVEKAVPFCHENVKGLVADLETKHGARIQRVTHKPRNPANRASQAELILIESLQQKLANGEALTPTQVDTVDGTSIYYAPIVIPAEACLKCHGQPGGDIAPTDLQLIRSLYPDDEAVDFKLGDLRGLWKVTFDPPTPKNS